MNRNAVSDSRGGGSLLGRRTGDASLSICSVAVTIRPSMQKPRIYIIAGSNGAGKTTFVAQFLPRYAGTIDFINADLIAKGLSPYGMADYAQIVDNSAREPRTVAEKIGQHIAVLDNAVYNAIYGCNGQDTPPP